MCCPSENKFDQIYDDKSMINKKLGRFLFTPSDFSKNVLIDNPPLEKPVVLGTVQNQVKYQPK